jgi:hypothetical protein
MNPLVDANLKQFDRSNALFKPLQEVMQKQTYGSWDVCVKEHLVRAATVRFTFRELGEEAGQAALKEEVSRSFIYVPALVNQLKVYEAQRDKYPTITDFAPQLIAVFDEALKNPLPTPPPAPVAAASGPKVISTTPANGAEDVDAAIAEIKVQFDTDMNPQGFSCVVNGDEGEFPETAGKPRWESPRIFVLPVKLKAGTKYYIGINTGRFTGFTGKTGQKAQAMEWRFEAAGE